MERLKWIELNWINKINQCILLSFASVNKCELCEMHPCYGLYCWLFVTPWTVARQASLSFTISQSLIKLMSIESVMPSNHLILCCPFSFCLQSFLASGSFPVSQIFISGNQSIGASTSASVLPMNIQGWSPSELTGLISLQSKGLSTAFSNTTVQKRQFFGAQLSSHSNSHIHAWPQEKP